MVATKVALEKKQALQLMNNFFQAFQNSLNRPTPPSPAEFEKCLSRNFQISSNGHVRSKTLSDYVAHIQKHQQKYSHAEITKMLQEPIIEDNKFVVTYNLELTPRSGKKLYVNFMAIGTVEDNKITNWEEVSHFKGEAQWDT